MVGIEQDGVVHRLTTINVVTKGDEIVLYYIYQPLNTVLKDN